MPQAKWTKIEDFSDGFVHKRDVTQMSPGSLIVGSKNVVITDGDRIGVRKGSELLGAASTATTPITSVHTMKRRDAVNIMMRAYDTNLEYYHPDTGAWENLNDGYTADQVFGFADHNVNDDALDYVYFGNAVESYSRWTGRFTQLNGALAGGEGTITVDSVLEDQVFFSGTASSVTTTTVDIATSEWAADIWDDFYVHITDGAQSGSISKITATTATQVTFGAIAGLSGTPTFEIRKVKFNDVSNLTLRIGTTNVTYTGFGSNTTFTGCTSTPVASDNDAVAQAITEYPENPKGNIFLVLHTRMYVAGVKDNQQALYHSAIADATDFTFSATRAADEGGIIDTPEGGGPITGIGVQEEVIFILKEDLIKQLTFTNDANDFPVIKPIIRSSDSGCVFHKGVFNIDNQLFFVSPTGGVKSVGRVANFDFQQALQLSDGIVSFVKTLDFTEASGVFHKQKAYIAAKTSGATTNDVVLVYNAQKKAWEAPIIGWNVADWAIYNNELHFGSSNNPEVIKVELDDVYDDLGNPFEALARFSYNNYGAAENPKDFQTLFMEGYISENTTITIKLRYNYLGTLETKETTLSGTDEDYMISNFDFNTLGSHALGLNPLGGVVTEDTPNDLQKFRVYFQTTKTPFYELSIEVSSDEEGSRWEILRFATDAQLLPNPITKLRKALN